MPPNPPSAQDIENARVALVIIVAGTVFLGSNLLRVAIVILAVVAVVGAFVLL
jgi:hypothetical protein